MVMEGQIAPAGYVLPKVISSEVSVYFSEILQQIAGMLSFIDPLSRGSWRCMRFRRF